MRGLRSKTVARFKEVELDEKEFNIKQSWKIKYVLLNQTDEFYLI